MNYEDLKERELHRIVNHNILKMDLPVLEREDPSLVYKITKNLHHLIFERLKENLKNDRNEDK